VGDLRGADDWRRNGWLLQQPRQRDVDAWDSVLVRHLRDLPIHFLGGAAFGLLNLVGLGA
jgi:hypothetical protein